MMSNQASDGGSETSACGQGKDGHRCTSPLHFAACSPPEPVHNHKHALPESMTNMRIFVVACVAAAVIAIGAAVVLHNFQEPVAVAFTTSAARI
jgi:hypothetical protein